MDFPWWTTTQFLCRYGTTALMKAVGQKRYDSYNVVGMMLRRKGNWAPGIMLVYSFK